jgi:hypothetical protein
MKDSVYQNSVSVKKRTEAAIALVYTDMMQGTLLELEYGLETARVTNGAHLLCVKCSEQTCFM